MQIMLKAHWMVRRKLIGSISYFTYPNMCRENSTKKNVGLYVLPRILCSKTLKKLFGDYRLDIFEFHYVTYIYPL